MGFFGGFPLEFSRQSHVLHQFRRHPMGASPWGGTSFKPRKPRNKPSDGGGDVSSDDRTFQHTLPDLTWRYLRFRYITVHSLHDMTYIYNHIIYILITMIIHVLYIYIIIYNHIHIRYIYIQQDCLVLEASVLSVSCRKQSAARRVQSVAWASNL